MNFSKHQFLHLYKNNYVTYLVWLLEGLNEKCKHIVLKAKNANYDDDNDECDDDMIKARN